MSGSDHHVAPAASPDAIGLPIPAPVRAVFNALAALAIAYLFIVVLMVAAAQQRVSSRLAKVDGAMDYSAGALLWSEVKDRRDDIAALTSDLKKKAAEVRGAEEAVAAAGIEFDAAWDQIAPIAKPASEAGCGRPVDQAAPDDMRARMLHARDLRQCLRTGSLPAFIAKQLNDEKLLADLFTRYRAVNRALRQEVRAKWLHADTSATLAAAKIDAKDLEVERSFSELNALTQSWLFGGSLLVQFPPSMLQIILAFASGMFGALLVTLVLVVYPKNRFSIASHGHYGARTLLGGLIAICVYVVLSGGTAVLGTNGFADGQANYMTFCAVGVLAGMFSDRVASWLSDRATTFFRGDAQADAEKKAAA